MRQLRRHGSAPGQGLGRVTSFREHYEYRATINGTVRHTRLHKIIAEYAIGEIINAQVDTRETHHIDNNQMNNKPSNLVIAKNRTQHKQLDLYSRIERIEGKPVTIKPRDAVYIGDIIRDDNFDIEIALSWWCETMERL